MRFLLNRRALLSGLAAASTAAAVPAAASAVLPSESPELGRLAKLCAAAAAEYFAAREALAAIVEEWERQWPLAPDEITGRGGDYERDITGAGLWRKGERDPRRVLDAETLERWVKGTERSVKRAKSDSRRAELMAALEEERRALALARSYEAEKARILEASGHEQAADRHKAAFDALQDTTKAIMAEPDRTMADVMIKAQALDVWSRVDRSYRAFTPGAADWGPMLAASIMRHTMAHTAGA